VEETVFGFVAESLLLQNIVLDDTFRRHSQITPNGAKPSNEPAQTRPQIQLEMKRLYHVRCYLASNILFEGANIPNPKA